MAPSLPGDAQQTRNRSGQPASATNFRSDYNLDSTINSGRHGRALALGNVHP